LSNNQAENLDLKTLATLCSQEVAPTFIVPKGLKRRLSRKLKNSHRVHIQELEWFESAFVQNTEIVFTPSKYWTGSSFLDYNKSLWGSFAVLTPTTKIFYVGDTGQSDDFKTITRFFETKYPESFSGFDLSLLPIGSCYFSKPIAPYNITPLQAVQAHQDLKSKNSVGIRWGTFQHPSEPWDGFARRLNLIMHTKPTVAPFTAAVLGKTVPIPLAL